MVKNLCGAVCVVLLAAFVETQTARAQDADDPNRLQNEVERTQLGVAAAAVLAGDDIATQVGNALENEAIRDFDALKGALPPTRTPVPTLTPQDEDLTEIQKGIETLELEAQSLK